MRAHTGGELSRLSLSRLNFYLRVWIADHTGALVNFSALSGNDWIQSASWGETQDQPVSTATVRLKRAILTSSLAPLMAASPLNAGGAAIDIARRITIETAATDPGVAPVAGDWKTVFDGKIDDVDWDADPIVLTCRDQGAWLQTAYIERQGDVYGSAAGTAVETVLQQLIARWVTIAPPTLSVPASPGWNIFKYAQDRKYVLEALRDLALQIGWELRYRWNASDQFLLTLYDPGRSNTTSLYTFTKDEYLNVTQLKLSDADIRNAVSVVFVDRSSLSQHRRTAVNGTSITAYRRRFMEVAQPTNIGSDAEADALGAAIVSDLGLPPVVQEIETFYWWMVQLGDLYTFQANAVHYDSDQKWAIVGYQHDFTEDHKARSKLMVRGTPSGAYRDWLRMQTGEQPIVSDDAIVGLNNFRWTDSADGLTRTFLMVAGSSVHRVAVFLTSMAVPPLTDPWPAAGAVPTALLTPILGVVTYSVTKPSTKNQAFVQFEPRLDDWSSGPVRRAVVDANPAAMAATLKDAVTNGTVDLSANVQAGLADWPVTVDFYADDPFGAVLATKSISANATLDKNTAGLAALGGLTLPLREVRRFWIKLTNVAGEVWLSDPISVDRIALPEGNATIIDYGVAPVLKLDYLGTTTSVVFRMPGPRTKTFSGLTGSGTVSYTVGDAIDGGGSVESAFGFEETRAGYQIDVIGGGVTTTIWGGGLTGTLHGPKLADNGQGSVSIDADGAWGWAVDLPAGAGSVKYAESTSGFPSDVTAAAGTVINGRQVSRTGGTPLTFGQTIYVTIVPFQSAGGNGFQMYSIRLRGSYTTFTATKTSRFAAASLFSPSASTNAQSYAILDWAINPQGKTTTNGSGTPDVYYALVPIAKGNTLISVSMRTYTFEPFDQVAMRLQRVDADGSVTQLGSTQTATNAGYSTLTVGSLSESTAGSRSYHVRADTMRDTNTPGIGTPAMLWIETVQTVADPTTVL